MKSLSPRSKAKLNGDAFYYSGSACKNGHTSKRRVDSGQCVDCATIRRKRVYQEQKKTSLFYNQFCNLCSGFTIHYGSNGNCKPCANKRSKDFHKENREKQISSMRSYYKDNKENLTVYKKRYYTENKNRILSYYKEYRRKNKGKIISYRKRPESLKRHRERQSSFIKTREGKLSQFLRNALHRTLKSKNNANSFDLVGYTRKELELRIESTFEDGMNWDNYGEWHIDHIVPLSVLVNNGIECVKVINSLNNLQAMWAKDNISKHCNYSGDIKKAIKELTDAT